MYYSPTEDAQQSCHSIFETLPTVSHQIIFPILFSTINPVHIVILSLSALPFTELTLLIADLNYFMPLVDFTGLCMSKETQPLGQVASCLPLRSMS